MPEDLIYTFLRDIFASSVYGHREGRTFFALQAKCANGVKCGSSRFIHGNFDINTGFLGVSLVHVLQFVALILDGDCIVNSDVKFPKSAEIKFPRTTDSQNQYWKHRPASHLVRAEKQKAKQMIHWTMQ